MSGKRRVTRLAAVAAVVASATFACSNTVVSNAKHTDQRTALDTAGRFFCNELRLAIDDFGTRAIPQHGQRYQHEASAAFRTGRQSHNLAIRNWLSRNPHAAQDLSQLETGQVVCEEQGWRPG